MKKSAKAFRTIGEVATWLNTEAYVLRFWESRFSHIKPIKRNDGRRYYRPEDMIIIGGIKTLLHKDGLTIKGVQKILREKGIKYVASLSPPVDTDFSIIEQPTKTREAEEKQNEFDTQKTIAPNTSSAVNVESDLPKIQDPTQKFKSLNKQEELHNVAKRLKLLRDKIQNQIENISNI